MFHLDFRGPRRLTLSGWTSAKNPKNLDFGKVNLNFKKYILHHWLSMGGEKAMKVEEVDTFSPDTDFTKIQGPMWAVLRGRNQTW